MSEPNNFCIHLSGVKCHRCAPMIDPITHSPIYPTCPFDLYCPHRALTPNDIITKSFQERLQLDKQDFLSKNPLHKRTIIDTLVEEYHRRNPHDLLLYVTFNKNKEGVPDSIQVIFSGTF